MQHQEFPGTPVYVSTDSPLSARPAKKNEFVEITEMSPNEVLAHVSLSGPRLLILSDLYSSGWSVRVDGIPTKVICVNGLLRGAEVPIGEHKVAFVYRPPGLKLGLLICSIATMILIVFLIRKK